MGHGEPQVSTQVCRRRLRERQEHRCVAERSDGGLRQLLGSGQRLRDEDCSGFRSAAAGQGPSAPRHRVHIAAVQPYQSDTGHVVR